eukprot:7860519-Pyramimonas_sp.AAC.1
MQRVLARAGLPFGRRRTLVVQACARRTGGGRPPLKGRVLPPAPRTRALTPAAAAVRGRRPGP